MLILKPENTKWAMTGSANLSGQKGRARTFGDRHKEANKMIINWSEIDDKWMFTRAHWK